MPDTPEQFAYGEALRAIESQQRVVDELRSRTGILLTGASLVTSLFGAAALEAEQVNVWSVIALLAFAAVVGSCIWIALPRRKAWRFSLSATVLLEDWADEPRSGDVTLMTRFLATTLEHNYRQNEDLLEGLYNWFTAAAVLLGVEVLAWALELA
jgi:hypothetical protein